MGKIYSLFIGRWQCKPHAGHIALIKTAIDRGKNVCVAIRDTTISEKNPYTVKERKKMIKKALKKAFGREWKKDKIKIITIPDIDEVLYGRRVGYVVKEVRLSTELESISGTEMRKKQKNKL